VGDSRQAARKDAAAAGPGLEGWEPPHWRRYGELTLTPLLAAGVEEFNRQGYHGATVRDIAQRAGVTLPTLYYHHGSKQELLFTLLRGAGHDALERCRAALADGGDRPEQRLERLVECVTLYMAHRRTLAFLDSEIRSLEPDNLARYLEQRGEVKLMLRGIVADGVRAGVFGTAYPVEASRSILSMCRAVAAWYRPDGAWDEAEVARRYVRIALDAVAFRPDVPHGGPQA
jgi:AcrR family transcriptional regulator